VPHTIEELTALKGIGKHTAGAILNYAFNQPVSFIETNIRTVYLHEFFHGQTAVGDEALEPYIELSLDKKRSREWHWALMDYGSFLKKTFPNPSRRSASYKKQTKFEGSRRQIRGMIIQELLAYKQSIDQLSHKIKDERLHSVLEELAKEEIIQSVDGIFELTDTPQLP
jgi:A/G-specific adenine glycosylase